MDELDPIDKALLDDFQRDFPLSPRPYAVIAERLGIDETETLARLRRLTAQGYIARIGLAVRPNTVGASTLAAMEVPPERLEEVAVASGVGARIDRDAIPVLPEVRAVCDHVGIDPYVSISEGTLIATVVVRVMCSTRRISKS